MKKFLLSMLSLLFLFTSCDFWGGNGGSSVQEENWDLSLLDTARNADYLNDVEKDVILEMNKARQDPKKYAELYIEPRISKFNGLIYDGKIITQEGVEAVKECVNVMTKMKALGVLNPSKGLTLAAKEHAETQSLTDKTGHESVDGTPPFDRIKKYGTYTSAGENIAYGFKTPREIVVGLLIDDGVANRGHRDNIMNEQFKMTGVGYVNRHVKYGSECVIDYAGSFIDKN